MSNELKKVILNNGAVINAVESKSGIKVKFAADYGNTVFASATVPEENWQDLFSVFEEMAYIPSSIKNTKLKKKVREIISEYRKNNGSAEDMIEEISPLAWGMAERYFD